MVVALAYQVLAARPVGPDVMYFRIAAPKVAQHWRAGQFVIVRVAEDGERIPLTVAAADADAGWIALVVQGVGRTTNMLNRLAVGDEICDVAGPLGHPTEIDMFGSVVVVGGGVGTAIAHPAAAALVGAGNRVIAIIGGRTHEHVLFEDELRSICADVIVTTDDGSRGLHGFVTDALAALIEADPPDRVVTAGPIPMMRAVAEVTRPTGIPTIASLNPIMVDGTGMCGGCRVGVGNHTRFACVDGPEFDAHQVDFALLANRNRAYHEFEQARLDAFDATVECHVGSGSVSR